MPPTRQENYRIETVDLETFIYGLGFSEDCS